MRRRFGTFAYLNEYPFLTLKKLGGEFMKGLSQLQTAYILPEKCRDLSKQLHRWREEVEKLFPNRHSKPTGIRTTETTGDTAEERDQEEHRRHSAASIFRRNLRIRSRRITELPVFPRSSRHITGKGRNVGTRSVLVWGSPVDAQSFKKFSASCKDLAISLHKFSFALYYVTDFQTTRCTSTVRDVIRTLCVSHNIHDIYICRINLSTMKEIHAILRDEMNRECFFFSTISFFTHS